MLKRPILIGIAVFAVGCASRPNPPAPALLPKTTPANSTLREDDPELDAAIAKARQTLDSFIGRLSAPKPREVFSVEAAFTAPDGTHEHLWIDDPVYKNGEFTGTLKNKPNKVTSIKSGDKVTVKKADVTDWLILTSGAQEGGYTVDVLMRRQAQPR